ncbi:DUF887-domain-containing protein [Sistotremastrum suecicum HHB10207 ss-3]|uniref:DUF887-domain-containing protein n=1 Tax=Sistotremastrum suecicum HHB10207 ss-3 TaxID=1314776 RepID=A0A166E8A2_9AGAM|nr:DUF887-domain-containing protein [Sistotremastrum suecicum HHB10207 ss-3]
MDWVSALLAFLDDRYAESLYPISKPIASALGLRRLSDHFPSFCFAAFAFQSAFVISGIISPYISRHYKSLPKRTRYQWRVKSASQLNALTVLIMGYTCFHSPVLEQDKVYGWDASVGRLSAVAMGKISRQTYFRRDSQIPIFSFLWDTIEVVVAGGEIAFMIHGFACLCIFSLGFKPFVAYFIPRSLIWEASTPFLNIHWWLDKTGRTGSTIQLINGIVLLSTFFCVRIVYGAYVTYHFWQALYSARDTMPLPVLITYIVGNGVLNILNWIWLSKMVSAITKRFTAKDEKVAPKADGNIDQVVEKAKDL